MSSHENSQNNEYDNQTWSHTFNAEDNVPRPPNPVTESRLLSKYLKPGPTNNKVDQDNKVTGSDNPPIDGNQPSQVDSSQTSQQQLTLPKAFSGLRVEAEEFVPKLAATLQTPFYQKQEYNTDNACGWPVTDANFVPDVSEDYNYPDSYYADVGYEGYSEDPNYLPENFNTLTMQDQFNPIYTYGVPSQGSDNPILDRFNQALHVLNMNPGNMEEYLRPICDMIQSCPDTTEIVNDVVESLFNQSIQEPNFRYTGARICQFLNTKLKGNPHFSGFHKIFLNRCQKDYNKRDELKNGSKEDQDKLRALAMFMAEIFLNVETETRDGTIQRLEILPIRLVDLLKTLLSTPSDLDVKCSCQLLKLSGALIEDVMKSKLEWYGKLEEVFGQLQTLQSSPHLTENTKFLVDSVLKLRKSNWNRSSSSSSSSPTRKPATLSSSEPNNFQAQDPVFYNQMGAPCSRTEAGFSEEDSEDGAYVLNEEEEAAYLTWQAEQEGLTGDEGIIFNNDTGYESFQLEVVDEGGMGDEMEAAYEEFLQKQTFLQGQPHLAGAPVQQIHTSVPMHHIFSHPPPNIPPGQDFSGYQQQQHMIPPPNQQLEQIPLQHHDPQHQYQMSQYHQNQQQQQQQPQQQQQQYPPQYTNTDPYHFRRM